MPHLLRERPMAAQAVLAGLVPAAFGALCGWLLGVNELAYVVLTVLAIGGGYFAGLEHRGPGEGAIRGIIGGTLFGSFILLIHEATGEEPKAELPHPEVLLIAVTAVFGVGLGALGGRRRERYETTHGEGGKLLNFDRLHWSEFVGFLGAGVLLGSLFLPWFSTSCERVRPNVPEDCNPNSLIHSTRGDFTAFETYGIMDILLVAACIAPFVLAYIIVRGHELTWRPGEVTMIVGMIAFALIVLNGVILGRPGEKPDNVDISIEFGYLIGLLGGALITAGGLIRQALGGRDRKPPGVL
jgi:hypothetical protein